MRAKFRLPWKKEIPQDELNILEAKLAATLTSVEPRAAFLESLEKKLFHAPIAVKNETKLALPDKKGVRVLLIGGISVLSGAVMIVTIVRSILAIWGMFGLAQEARKKQLRTQTA